MAHCGAHIPFLVACGLLLGGVIGNAQVTVRVDSSKQWLSWVTVLETNGNYVSGSPWPIFELPAIFIPTNSASNWPLNTHLVLRPNISSYNTNDAFWNFPDGRPNKILEANVYVEIPAEFGGKTVIFKGSVTTNSIPGLAKAAPPTVGKWSPSSKSSPHRLAFWACRPFL